MASEKRCSMWEWLFSTPLSDREMTTLTLWQQRKKSRQFPVTLGFNLLMLLICVAQCLMVSLEYTNYNRGNENGFRNTFHPEELRDGLFSIQEVMEVLEQLSEKYYTFPETAVSPYSHVKLKESESDEPRPPVLTVYRYRELKGRFWLHPIAEVISGLDEATPSDGASRRRRRSFNANRPRYAEMATEHSLNWIDDEDLAGDFGLEATVYDLPRTQPLKEVFGYTGPESLEGSMLVHNEFYHVSKMTLAFSFRGADIGVLGIVPFYWDLELVFKVYGAQVTFGIDVDLRIRNTTGISKSDIFELTNVIILLFATLSLLASLRGLALNTGAFLRTRRTYLTCAPKLSSIDTETAVFPTWQSIPLDVKVHFWSFWYTLDALSCFVFIAAAILGLLREEGLRISAMYSVIFGFGTMLTFLNMLRYLECHPRLYLHISTLRGAFISVVAFCLSVSPIFLGYTFFGLLNFGPYAEKFMNLDETATTLFCLIAGDDIHDTFEKIADGGYPIPFVGRLFIYTFVIIFLTSVLNVFIFLIEDAYDNAKQTLRGPNGQPLRRRRAVVQLSAIFDNVDRWRSECGEPAGDETSIEVVGMVQQEGIDIELAQFSSGSSDAEAAAISESDAKATDTSEQQQQLPPAREPVMPPRTSLRIEELQQQLLTMAELLEGTQKQLANLQDQLALISQSR